MSNYRVAQFKLRARITVTGVEELRERLSKIEREVRGEAARKAVHAGGLIIEGAAKDNIHETFSDAQTNELAGSIQTFSKTNPEGTRATATIAVQKEYARIQEFGGTIVPVNAKMLHWEQDGEHIFAKSVTLPERPYFRPAIDDHHEEILAAMGSALNLALERG